MKYIYTIMFSILLMSCNDTNHAVVKVDDELSSNIKILIEKYVDNDFDVSDYYTDDVVTRINNLEITGYENLMQGFQAHHDVLYDNIVVEDLYVHTNYFTSGDIWSNAWFTWKGTGKTSGEEYSNRGHFDYKWEDGKIAILQAYYSEYAEQNEAAAYAASQN